MSEDDLFAKEMGLVTPIQSKARVQAESVKKKHEILRSLEGKEVIHQHNQTHSPLNIREMDEYLLCADGVATKDIKKLAQSTIKHELDLHGLTQDEATTALSHFFNQALNQNIRRLSIVHGQGRHSKHGKSVLKDCTFQWLRHGEFSSYILIATLSSKSGGGACHVLLRKQGKS